ncbi:MAG: hypothetical protein ACR2K6_07440 [Solirubrobacterales bacterium]
MKLLPGTLAAFLALAWAGGCGEEVETTPTACLSGPKPIVEALQAESTTALIGGEVPLQDCLVREQPPGELNTVGEAMITVATQLNVTAREADTRADRDDAAARLGYLLGAAEEAASETAGVHEDLIRRLNSAARFTEDGGTTSAAFERSYGAGYATARGG